jgi:hypothetical protein
MKKSSLSKKDSLKLKILKQVIYQQKQCAGWRTVFVAIVRLFFDTHFFTNVFRNGGFIHTNGGGV